MNQDFNPVFAFKKLFSDGGANELIRELINHSIIWQCLSEEKIFLFVVENLGNDPQNWKLENVINVVEKLVNSDSSSQKNNGIQRLEKQLGEILITAQLLRKIREKRKKGEQWSNIFQNNNRIVDKVIKEKRIWELLFSCFLNDEKERILIEKTLFETENAEKFLALFLNQYQKQSWVSEFTSRYINQIIISPKKIKKIIFYLFKLGGRKIGYQLARETLESSMYQAEISSYENGSISLEVIPKKIEELNDFHQLSNIIDDEEKMKKLKKHTENLLKNFHNHKMVKLYEQNQQLELNALLSLDTFYSINDQKSLIKSLDKLNSLGELFLAFEIMESNISAARDICERFFFDVTQLGLNKIIFSSEIGFILDPIDIAKLFINVGLEHEAIDILENKVTEQNISINKIKFLAHYLNVFGDHKKAQKYYSDLFALGTISREEKVMFCESLKYLDHWEDVYTVRKTINPLNLNDEIEMAIVAYQTNNYDELENSLRIISSKFPNRDIEKILEFLLLQTDSQDERFDEFISIVLKEPMKEFGLFSLIEKFLKRNENYSRIDELIKNLPKKFKNNPEIQLLTYKTEKRLGDYEACKTTLINLSKSEAISKQIVFEEIILELFENELFLDLEDLHNRYVDKWNLSPVINLSISKVLLRSKNFAGAKKKILYLIKNESITEEIISFFGCSILETRFIELPYRNSEIKIIEADKTKFQELIENSTEKNRTLVNKILRIEICGKDKEKQYKEIYEEESNQNNSDYWRIPFGLGQLFFEKRIFDQAVKYFKEVQKIKPTQRKLVFYLIQSYCQLKMVEEAIELVNLQKEAKKLSIVDLVNILEFLFEYKEFETFLLASEREDPSSIMYSIVLAKLAAKIGDIKSAEFQLSKIESKIDPRKIEMLAVSQCYFDCGKNDSSKRILEKYLSNINKLDSNSIILTAALYYQTQEYDKAQNLINRLRNGDKLKRIIEADILQKKYQIFPALEILESVIASIEQLPNKKGMHKINYVKIPIDWTLDLPELISKVIDLYVNTNNFEKAFELVKQEMKKFPNSKLLKDLALKISYLTKNAEFIIRNTDYFSKDIDGLEKVNTLIMASAALDRNQEIQAAKIFSQLKNKDEKDDLTSLFKTRLLIRNGNLNDAKNIYQSIILNYQITSLTEEINSENKLKELITQLLLGETALDLDDVQMSFDISKDIYQKYGSIARSNILYLKSLTKMLERNRLFEVIRVKNHNFKITDDDLNIMLLILDQVGNKLDESGEWKIMAEMLSNPHELNYKRISNLEPTNENIYAKIIALGELDRMNEVENLLEIFGNNVKGLFTYAIINLNKNPEITQSIVHKILENDKPDPSHLAVLAFAYEKLGNYADSYSSICLALNIWPNEYEWEILAGKLSKQLGNNLASFSHFKNAENYNKNNRDTLEPYDILNEQIGIIEKSVLGSEFTNSAKDIPQLFKIIDFLIKEKKFENIEIYLNKLKKYDIPFKEIPLIEAKIELNYNRFSESLKLVETVLQDDRWNLDAIIIKSEIISKIENAKSALEYLDQIDFEKLDNSSAFIIQRANLLEQSLGSDSAIEYLIKEKEINKDNLDISVCLANLYLKEGNPLIAQDIAIEALNINAENSGLLHLLGNISKDLGDLDKAIDYLMRSITIAPFFTENYIQLSKMFESRRDYKDSIEILKKGLEIIPNDFSLLRYTGLLFYKQGKYTEAHVKLKKALDMYPKDSDLVKIIRILENSLQIKNQKMKNR